MNASDLKATAKRAEETVRDYAGLAFVLALPYGLWTLNHVLYAAQTTCEKVRSVASHN